MSTDYFMVCSECRVIHNHFSRNVNGLWSDSNTNIFEFITDHLGHVITVENERSEIVEDINWEHMNASRYLKESSMRIEKEEPKGLIIGVFVKYTNDHIIMLPKPNRHGDCMHEADRRDWGHWTCEDADCDGFYTENNVLLNRADAMEYVIRIGQELRNKDKLLDILFSEDLW